MERDELDGQVDRSQVSGESEGSQAASSSAAMGSGASASPASAVTTISRRRLVLVNLLIGLTTVLLVVGIFAVFANRLLFSPDNWANTSTQLLQNADVRSSTANYLVDQLYANVNVAGLIKSGLPSALQPLASPVAGALRNAAVQGVELALTRPRVQSLWAQANRAADQTFIAIVKGGKGPVGVNQGAVTLNLSSILDDVASRLGLPSNLGSKLPASAANVTVFKSDKLKLIQDVGNAIQGLALWLTIITPLLYALAIVLARGHRRRVLMTVGFAGVFGGVLVLFGRSLLISQIPGSLTNDASLKPTIAAVISIATEILSQVASACIIVGILLIAAGWFAGPARVARAAREAIAPFLRDHAGPTYAIVLGVMALIFIWSPIHATGTPAGIIVFTVLALLGTELLRRQTAVEFPDARPGAAAEAMRTRISAIRQRRQQPRAPSVAAASTTTAEQLNQLAELRAHDEITSEEYQAAKSQLLHS